MEFEEEVHCCLAPSKSFLHFFSFIMVKIWNPGWNTSQINLSTLCMCVCIYIYMYMCVCVCVCMYGFPWWLSDKEFTYQCRRRAFNPWVRKIPWRRKWPPTPVFLPGKSHGQRSLAGCSPWDHERVGHNSVSKQQTSSFLKWKGGTFLVAQWLRLCLPMQVAWFQSLVRELDPTCLN